jgi:hypothetical protein
VRPPSPDTPRTRVDDGELPRKPPRGTRGGGGGRYGTAAERRQVYFERAVQLEARQQVAEAARIAARAALLEKELEARAAQERRVACVWCSCVPVCVCVGCVCVCVVWRVLSVCGVWCVVCGVWCVVCVVSSVLCVCVWCAVWCVWCVCVVCGCVLCCAVCV